MTDLEIFIPLENLIDFDKERARIDKEIEKIRGDLGRVEQKLNNESFIGKAPAEVIEREKAKRGEMAGILSKLEASRAKLG